MKRSKRIMVDVEHRVCDRCEVEEKLGEGPRISAISLVSAQTAVDLCDTCIEAVQQFIRRGTK